MNQKTISNRIPVTDFEAPELDVYARMNEIQLLNRHEPEKGLFIAMPSRKAADGEYRDIAHPINSGTRDMIQRVILDKYETTTLEEAQAV